MNGLRLLPRSLRLGAALLPRPFLPTIQAASLSQIRTTTTPPPPPTATATASSSTTTTTTATTTTTTPKSTTSPSLTSASTSTKARPKKQQRAFSKRQPPAPTKTEEQLGAELSYVVKRTVSQGIPVYRKWKAGHTREIVLVKKVEGNRARLVEDLTGALGVAGDRIRINPTTLHVELQGDYFEKAKEWLLQKGF